MTKNLKLKCHGCNTPLPKGGIDWTAADGTIHWYCPSCDDCLIADVPTPNQRRELDAQAEAAARFTSVRLEKELIDAARRQSGLADLSSAQLATIGLHALAGIAPRRLVDLLKSLPPEATATAQERRTRAARARGAQLTGRPALNKNGRKGKREN